MERFFQIAAVIFAGVAAYFLWSGKADGAFVSVVLGAVAFFLSVRFQVKDRIKQREIERSERERAEFSALRDGDGFSETEEISRDEQQQRTSADRIL